MQRPHWTLSQIASELGLKLIGVDKTIGGLSTLEAAGPTDLTFLANSKYSHFLSSTKAGAVILSEAALPSEAQGKQNITFSVLLSPNPYADFATVLGLFAKPQGTLQGISQLAFIHPEAVLGANCTIYPFAYIGARAHIQNDCVIFPGSYVGEDCLLGAGCTIYPHATLMAGTRLGVGCILHAGVVLGADGFGFTRVGGTIRKVPQIGSVTLGNNVEIGANSTVDKGVLGPTAIGDDSKLDNLVQIGHNVQIGKQAIIVAQTGIAGSSKVGDEVTIAAKVGVAGHLTIGSRSVIGPLSGVAKDVPEGFKGGGIPLMEEGTYMRHLTLSPKLPEMSKRIKQLERELEELKKIVTERLAT